MKAITKKQQEVLDLITVGDHEEIEKIATKLGVTRQAIMSRINWLIKKKALKKVIQKKISTTKYYKYERINNS